MRHGRSSDTRGVLRSTPGTKGAAWVLACGVCWAALPACGSHPSTKELVQFLNSALPARAPITIVDAEPDFVPVGDGKLRIKFKAKAKVSEDLFEEVPLAQEFKRMNWDTSGHDQAMATARGLKEPYRTEVLSKVPKEASQQFTLLRLRNASGQSFSFYGSCQSERMVDKWKFDHLDLDEFIKKPMGSNRSDFRGNTFVVESKEATDAVAAAIAAQKEFIALVKSRENKIQDEALARTKRAQAYRWTRATGSTVPAGAVSGSGEPGRPAYVCRLPHTNGLHPGFVAEDKCRIGWGGNEVTGGGYEILVGPAPQWIAARGGSVPEGALVGGGEKEREQLFICRVRHAGIVYVGKIVGSTCNVGAGGREVTIPKYEVLVP